MGVIAATNSVAVINQVHYDPISSTEPAVSKDYGASSRERIASPLSIKSTTTPFLKVGAGCFRFPSLWERFDALVEERRLVSTRGKGDATLEKGKRGERGRYPLSDRFTCLSKREASPFPQGVNGAARVSGRLAQPFPITAIILAGEEDGLSIVAALDYVQRLIGQEVAADAGHGGYSFLCSLAQGAGANKLGTSEGRCQAQSERFAFPAIPPHRARPQEDQQPYFSSDPNSITTNSMTTQQSKDDPNQSETALASGSLKFDWLQGQFCSFEQAISPRTTRWPRWISAWPRRRRRRRGLRPGGG